MMQKEQIRRAIELIVVSSNKDRLIIDNFDPIFEMAKGPDSDFSNLISETARERNLDLKYLYDGANFLLSRLHSSDNYYKVLCLRSDASGSDIKRRWRQLIELYHPDRHEGKSALFTERAKRVNEAYSILKDERKRKEYNEKLWKERASFEGRKEPDSFYEFTMKDKGASRNNFAKNILIFGRPAGRFRRKMPRYIMALYITGCLMFITFFFLKYYSVESPPRFVHKPAETGVQEDVDVKTSKPFIPLFSDIFSKRSEIRTAYTKPGSEGKPDPALQDKKIELGSDGISHDEKEAKAADGAVKDSIEQKIPQPSYSEKSRPEGFETPWVQQGSDEVISKMEAKESIPSYNTVISGKNTSSPTPDETRAFLKEYAETYEKGDINRFMKLFSRQAVENGSRYYEGIREVYAKTFEDNSSIYQLSYLEIKQEKDSTSVNGVYHIRHHSNSTGDVIKRRGKINWKLIREGGAVKVLTVDYKGF